MTHYDEPDVEELANEMHRRFDRCRSVERFRSDYLQFVQDHVLDNEVFDFEIQHEDWLEHRTLEQIIESRARLTTRSRTRLTLAPFINPETMPVTASFIERRHPPTREDLRIHTRIPTGLYHSKSSPSISEMTQHARLKHELQLMHAVHKNLLRRLVP